MAGQRLESTDHRIPLVIVEGFLSATSAIGWRALRTYLDGFKAHLNDRTVLLAKWVLLQLDFSGKFLKLLSIGPVSSLHDRACELYYAIKGGTGTFLTYRNTSSNPLFM